MGGTNAEKPTFINVPERIDRRKFINTVLLAIGGVLTLGGGIYGGFGVVEEREVWSKNPNATNENLQSVGKEITIFENKVRDQVLTGKTSMQFEDAESIRNLYLERDKIIKTINKSQAGREKSFLGAMSVVFGGMAFLLRKK